jgi:hypothetical protein
MKHLAILLTFLAAAGGWAKPAPTFSLAGEWRFQLDRADAGIREQWFARALDGSIRLPGSLPERGIGDAVTTNTEWTGGIVDRTWFTAPEYARYRQPGNIKIPFWLQPETYYAGAAWYQRDVQIPKEWAGRRVTLALERAHWETRVWLDGKLIGSNASLATPHEYDLGLALPGARTLTVRVDNRRIADIGENSHAISDHTQGNWNGLEGRIELRAGPPVWLEDLQVYPHWAARSATVRGTIGNSTGAAGRGKICLDCNGVRKEWEAAWDAGGGSFETEFALGANAKLWDEFSPNLYTLRARLNDDGEREATFGLREIATDGTQFTINGRKTFFRGTLECCIFPKTGHPPTELGEWKRIIRVAKSYGLNLIRFHSYCPPEAAFEAADQLGMYLQVETCWANQSTVLGVGRPVDRWVYDETERILKYYGNHPSFVLMPYGNEPAGEEAANAYLAGYVTHFKALDPRRLWTSGSGWPQLPENQFHVTPDPRIQQWEAGLKSRINSQPPETTTDYRDIISSWKVPVISHEMGQWCAYPSFDEIPKYTGYLKPKNFEIFRDLLAANGMGRLAKPFLLASGALQTLCYKEDIESALRTPGMGGFELLDLHDFPGQGTALVGVLDAFWDEKGYVTARQYRRFCNATVPLARLAKRVFTTDETLAADIEAAHFGAAPIRQAGIRWKLEDENGRTFAGGKFAAKDIPVDNGIALGRLAVDLKNAKAPARYKLVVAIQNASKGSEIAENDWDVWVYPSAAAAIPNDTLVTSRLDDQAAKRLESGGSVLLTLPPESIRNFDSAPVQVGFSSIFWNTAWTSRQPPTTLGILCDPKHPALADFPTDFHGDWQWWHLLHRAGALRLDAMPENMEPIVRLIDDWATARPLGLVIEARVGRGKIVVCGFDLTGDMSGDPAGRQMRQSLLRYMAGGSFNPKTEIRLDQARKLCQAR